MSALITAERGRTYLSFAGRRLHVTKVTAYEVLYYDATHPDWPLVSARSLFENEIESVLE